MNIHAALPLFRISIGIVCASVAAGLFAPLRADFGIFLAGSIAAILVTKRFVLRRTVLDLPYLWLGAVTPLIPFFGTGGLLPIALIFSFLFVRSDGAHNLRAVIPLVVVVFVGLLAAVGPMRGIISAVEQPTLSVEWIQNVRAALIAYGLPAIERFLLWVSFCLLLVTLVSCEKARSSIGIGILIGSCVAVTTVIAQGLSLLPLEWFASSSPFWSAIGRFSGTFSDPNACGIYCLLLTTLCLFHLNRTTFGLQRIVLGGLLLITFVAALYAGSRTYLLGIAGLLILFAWRRSARTLRIFALVGVLLVVIVATIEHMYQISDQLQAAGAPTGIVRVVRAADSDRLSESFLNRLIFYRAAIAMWTDHLFTGVGLHAFSRWVPSYSQELGLGLDQWVDNSNNFYLGIAAELGLLGVLGFFLTLYQFEWRTEDTDLTWILRDGVIVFFLTMLVGPHIDFAEVSIFVCYLISAAARIAPDRYRLAPFLALGIISMTAGSAAFFGERGTYPPERAAGKWSRWSGSAARIVVPCSCSGEAKIDYVVHHAASTAPVAVTTSFLANSRTYLARQPGQYSVSILCPAMAHVGTARHARILSIGIEVDPPWRPRDRGIGNDPRLLGVQILGLRELAEPIICR